MRNWSIERRALLLIGNWKSNAIASAVKGRDMLHQVIYAGGLKKCSTWTWEALDSKYHVWMDEMMALRTEVPLTTMGVRKVPEASRGSRIMPHHIAPIVRSSFGGTLFNANVCKC